MDRLGSSNVTNTQVSPVKSVGRASLDQGTGHAAFQFILSAYRPSERNADLGDI